MPKAAQRPCSEQGCRARCGGRYCDKHTLTNQSAEKRLNYDRHRGSPSKRGYGRRWERLRLMVLARDPLCKIMILCDGTAISTDADHKISKREDGEDTLENLQGACHACHSYKTATEDSNFARRGKRK